MLKSLFLRFAVITRFKLDNSYPHPTRTKTKWRELSYLAPPKERPLKCNRSMHVYTRYSPKSPIKNLANVPILNHREVSR